MDIFLQRLNRELPQEYRDMISYYDCWLSGGAILSLVMGTEINDFDIYFKTKYDAYEFYKELNGTLISNTDKSLVVKKHKNGETYFFNLIIFRYFDYAQDIFDSFDFTCCKAAWTGKKFIYDSKFMPDVASRRIVYTPSFRYPIASLLRVYKYQKKEFTISRNEMLKIIFQITQHPINSIKDLEEELGSHYGIALNKIYPKDEEFTIPKLIDVLSNLPDDIFEMAGDQTNVKEPEMFKEIKEEIEKRTFEDHIPKSLEYSKEEYSIVTPICRDDVEQEGRDLKHYVGSYISGILKGKNKILFLRKTEKLDKSLCTIDVIRGKVVAAKGEMNRDLTKEEMEFLVEYCEFMKFRIKPKNLLRKPFIPDLGR